MEDITFNADGSVNLPVGFRFDPNNEVLLNHYLRRKIFSQPLNVQVMQQLNVFQTEPWNLPADEERFTKRKYYFFDLREVQFENKDKRAAGSGEWRTEKSEKVIPLQSTHYMGKKTTLVYWKMQLNGDFEKTRWMMEEFRLSLTARPLWVSHLAAYRVYEEKAPRTARKVKKGRGTFKKFINGIKKESVIDMTVESGIVSTTPPPPITP